MIDAKQAKDTATKVLNARTDVELDRCYEEIQESAEDGNFHTDVYIAIGVEAQRILVAKGFTLKITSDQLDGDVTKISW